MITDMERLLESGTLTDVTIKCGAPDTHRIIECNIVRDMIKFIYSGRLKDLADKSDLLLAAADKYDIRDLKSICCQHLAANLATDQIVDILVLADIHKATDLKNQAIKFLL